MALNLFIFGCLGVENMYVIDENLTSLEKAETTCTRLDLGIPWFVLPRFVKLGFFV